MMGKQSSSNLFSLPNQICEYTEKYLPWQCAAAEGHHVVMVAHGTGGSYHLHLSTGSLQIRHRGLSVGGASRQDGLWSVGGQGVGGGPRDDGLWLAGNQGVVNYNWTTNRSQTVNPFFSPSIYPGSPDILQLVP